MKQFFESSTNSGEISLTLKGIAVLLIPIGIQFANKHGVAITQDMFMQGVSQISAIIAQLAIAIGLIRKFINWGKLLLRPA